jgi:hypothetical protein
MMKFMVLFSILFVAQAHAQNAIYGYDYWAPVTIKTYLDQVDQNSPARGPDQCAPMYKPMTQKGVLDVRYALGYFDDSTGVERVENGKNYGLSPSLDIAVFHALRQRLTAACEGNLQLCGFSESGDANSGKVILQKNVRIQGDKVLVRITLTQASASESFTRNKGDLAGRQSFLTQQSEANFFDGLKTADVVIYNGHSRNGGGPDFNPPILRSSDLHVNYNGYYKVKRPGIKRTFANLKENPNPAFILGLFSCYSRRHFYNDFMKVDPKLRLILSADTIDYFDSLRGSVGYLEGLLRGSCGQDLADTAKQGAKMRGGFQSTHFN